MPKQNQATDFQGRDFVVPTQAPRLSSTRLRSLASAFLVAGVVACGGGGETAPPPPPTPDPVSTPKAPPAPTINSIESDNVVSVAEASDGVPISGQAEPNTLIIVDWSGATKQVSSNTNGAWAINYAQGEVPAAGSTMLSAVASNANGSSAPTQRVVVVESGPTGPTQLMALGDSMLKGDESDTAGNSCTAVFPNTSWRSFRGNLQQRLSNAGHAQQWLGSQTLTPASGGTDPDHEGYAGLFIGPINAGDAVRGSTNPGDDTNNCRARSTTPTSDGSGNGNLIDRLATIFGTGADPDLIVFFGGWNSVYCDSAQNQFDSSTTADKMTQLVDQIATLRPNAKLLLTTLTPQRNQTEAQTNSSIPGFAQYNQRIRDLAATRANVYLADLASLSFASTEYWDIIHWCQPAADKVGQAIFDVIQANNLMQP